MDDLDRAEAYESKMREVALQRHAQRPRVIPDCEECGEVPVHVTTSGLIWRVCADCGEALIAAKKAA